MICSPIDLKTLCMALY